MNKLTIDIGNTGIKIALFQNQQLVWCRHFADLSPEHLEQLMEDHQVKHAIASNVSARSMSAFTQVKGFVLLSSSLKMPFENLYASPETLGADRMALAAATQFFYKGKNCMVFDAGTCLTMDFVNNQGQYLGGFISPGLQMRLNSMHQFTGKLPQLTADMSAHLIGNSTAACMQSGAYHGMIAEIEHSIQQLKTQFSDLQVILCGGNAELLSKQLKSPLFVEKNMLMYGLHLILDLNV